MINYYTLKPAQYLRLDSVGTQISCRRMRRRKSVCWTTGYELRVGGIAIEQLISVSQARPVALGAKVALLRKDTFLLCCKGFDFSSHHELAARLVEHLSTVPFKRIDYFYDCF